MNPAHWYQPGPPTPRWTFLDTVNWAALSRHERRFAGWPTLPGVTYTAAPTYGPSTTPTEDSRS